MARKIISIVSIVILLCGCAYYLYRHRTKTETISNANVAIKAIPIDASFIFESRKTLPLWKNISQTNEIWSDLLETPYFAELNHQLNSLDSIIKDNPELGNALESQPLFISAHINGMNRFNFLFICSVVDEALQSGLSGYLESVKQNNASGNLQYEETTIHCIKLDESNSFYYTIYNGIFISSYAPALIKESLRQLESGISLLNNAYFTKVLNASGGQPVANVFINFQTFTNISSQLFNRNFFLTLSSMQDLGQWMGLDITINPDELIMTGFTDCDSTGSQFLNLFQRQSSQEFKVASVAPANTAFMVCHEFSDYGTFHKDYMQYIGVHNKNRDRAEWIDRIQRNYDLNIEKYFYPWIKNEAVQLITQPSDSTLQNDTYTLIEATDIHEAVNKLSRLADTIKARKKIRESDSTYMHHEIRNLYLDNVMGNLLGYTFSGVTKSWFTSIGNYVVFANSMSALKTFIYEFEANNTLEKDPYYKDFIKQHVESESGIYIYNNMAFSSMVYGKYLEKSYMAAIAKHKNVLSKFHAASVQFSFMQGMFYTNVYLKRNPMFRKEASPAWQLKLDTVLAAPPAFVSDYNTHEQFVMGEDKNSTIYLINNNGSIEWKKRIDGEIQSPVFDVDALRNKKIQYLFNTSNGIVLLDRKGNGVGGFPLKLRYSATAPLNVIDYDNNRNYRLLLPGSDLKIHEYDIGGNPVKDWTLPQTQEAVKCPSHYCRIDKADYLIFVDDGGKVYALDRKGNDKLNLDNRLPSHLRDFYITQGNSLSDSYLLAADSVGTVFKLSLTGELTTIQYLKKNYANPGFVPVQTDSTGKQGMAFLTSGELWAYTSDRKELFHTKIKEEMQNELLLFPYPDHTFRIGAIDPKNEKIYCWDNTGNLCQGFPLHGSVNFSIADMKNDGSLYLLTGADNKVYVYGLP